MIQPDHATAPDADRERQILVDDLAEVARESASAMSRVFALTSGRINALLLRMLRDPAAAEEVLQEVYLTVWRRGATFDPARASPMTWLVTIARSRAIDRIRSDRSRRSLALEAAEAASIPDPSASAVDRIEEAERTRGLLACMEELEERQRAAIRAAYFEGLTYEDLAAREGVPLGTMKSWIRRGLLRLRGCMDR